MTQGKKARGTILVVDDNITNLKVASEHLRTQDYEVLTARDGESGIERAKLGHPELILLDVQMPGIDGFETCQRLKADEGTKDIPVIFMTVLNNVEDKLKGFEAGGTDYVPKPFQMEELLARVNTHITVYRLQRELRAEIRERLLAEQKIRQFVADASHELRSPLTVLGGYLDILLMGAKEDPVQTDRILNTLQSEVNRLGRLVVDLLTLTRLDTNGRNNLRLEKVCPADLLRRLQDNFQTLAGTRRIELNIEDGLLDLTFKGDGDQLYQVFSNLVDNALRYTPPDGLVRLSLSQTNLLPSPAKALADLVSAERNSWILIQVQDNGCGIAPEKLPHIFNRFYRADSSRNRKTGNAGLGLSISKSIVEAHNGCIWVESEPENGTTFSILLWKIAPPGKPLSYLDLELEFSESIAK